MARLVLTNANLLDGSNPAAAGNAVVVDGPRIAAVHAGAATPARRDGDRVVDLAGKTLMPGMTTRHFHSTYHDLGARPTPHGYDHRA